jgi:predicted metal-dependent hydrolase
MKHCRKLGQLPVDIQRQMTPLIGRGIGLFNSRHFFEAHEVLEEIWRAAPQGEMKFWQGLIQTAVAFHHRSIGNTIGAQSLLNRAIRNLSPYPDIYGGIQLRALKVSLEKWQEEISKNDVDFLLPTIRLNGDSL